MNSDQCRSFGSYDWPPTIEAMVIGQSVIPSASADGAFHFEVDEALELDRVFHGELAG